jgi:hypothetical protein
VKRIVVYHNHDCAKCRRIARVHRLFDWLNRVETSTDESKTGPLLPGEIAVEDLRTGAIVKGLDAVRLVGRNVPAYALFLPFLRIPSIARKIDREVRGCSDGSCAVPQEKVGEEAAIRT